MAKLSKLPEQVVGIDCAFDKKAGVIFAAAVVWDLAQGSCVEQAWVRLPLDVPYVPGYLSFREGPAVNAALDKLKHKPQLLMFDGQGIAHPRRCGLATHVGAERRTPSIGVAKSILVGEHEDLDPSRGSRAPLVHRGTRVGTAIRLRDKVKPVFISVGCGVTLAFAEKAVLACSIGFRLPEPTRQADQLVGRVKQSDAGR